MSEKLSQTARILKLLQSKRRVSSHELNRLAYRYSARIAELRQEGHQILTERVKEGVFAYTYLGHEDDQETAA
ncbi:hypothetical protein HAV21_03310 [Paenarthrobacter sp. MSM-2-10-13]|uniref:helix-turn-helix domain-containing protein n=1 Tax=Paenarthrobacter sp. MSM-2-10-13 TaxID=2717318 RepID=UPI00141FF259|nr:helix-turn-helix domain-containing protein [Paenarthrobacter sp. MSM-2-10-13]NHW45926.1 hypothetical protein [Paenarthrobacter sp. MSM-2-10-13]